MTLQFTNTATRTKEPFVPIDANNVRMYVCGPTVYDFAHIGNARPAVVFDVLFRLLRHVYGPDHVTYVRNITDVDDKINARAARDFPDLPLNEAIARVTEKTTAQYHADLAALGCLEPTHEPRATEHIPGMIAMIETLIAKGNAYVADGPEGQEVLFDTASMANYGALSKRNLDEQQAGARIAVEGHKKNPGDFVLWKLSSAEEPGWDSPWGRGRPGWHIECSVMSAHHLGETFDIHGGGLDLIFPHHENEIAQSCCAHGTDKMANTWLHNGFVQVEGRKMSKSEGNFVTIHDVLHTEKVGGRKWPGEVVRLALLMTHYREPLDFSVQRLLEAEKLLDQWANIIDRIGDNWKSDLSEHPVWSQFDVNGPSADAVSALKNDLQVPALIALFRRHVEQAQGKYGGFWQGSAVLNLHYDLLLLGIDLRGYTERKRTSLGFVDMSVLENAVEAKIAIRLQAIADKDWNSADIIRDKLLEQGIQLQDYKDPETGERKTKWEVKR